MTPAVCDGRKDTKLVSTMCLLIAEKQTIYVILSGAKNLSRGRWFSAKSTPPPRASAPPLTQWRLGFRINIPPMFIGEGDRVSGGGVIIPYSALRFFVTPFLRMTIYNRNGQSGRLRLRS